MLPPCSGLKCVGRSDGDLRSWFRWNARFVQCRPCHFRRGCCVRQFFFKPRPTFTCLRKLENFLVGGKPIDLILLSNDILLMRQKCYGSRIFSMFVFLLRRIGSPMDLSLQPFCLNVLWTKFNSRKKFCWSQKFVSRMVVRFGIQIEVCVCVCVCG